MGGSPSAVIGVDIGGTNIKVALVEPKRQEVLHRQRFRTLAERGPEAVLADIVRCLAAVCRESEKTGLGVAGIGVGSAGLIDLPAGIVLTSPNLPGWVDFPLAQRLRQRLGIPVLVENDVNCFGLGEYWQGAGRDLGDFLGIAMGTGIGGCLIVDGKAWSGAGYSTGEIGHMTIRPDGERCRCGNRGCLETLASASWLVWRAEQWLRRGVESSLSAGLESPEALVPEQIYQAAVAGDQMAQELFHQVGASLAIAIANVVHLLDLRGVVIGGGLANAWDAFIGPLQEELQLRLTLVSPTSVKLVRARLGDDAGALGAAYLVARQAGLVAARRSQSKAGARHG